MKRAKQVETELPARVAGQHRSSRRKMVAELVEPWLEGRQSVRPIAPATIAAYRGDIDRFICRASVRSRSRPAGAATLDTFYVRLRQQGGRAGRPLAPS